MRFYQSQRQISYIHLRENTETQCSFPDSTFIMPPYGEKKRKASSKSKDEFLFEASEVAEVARESAGKL